MAEEMDEKIINWEEKIENILKGIEITDEDFRRKGATSEIHSRILDAIQDEWNKSKMPVLEERAFQIDFVGRTFPRHGKVELVIEVDTWFKPTGNWVKLLDINSADKVWIYVCKEKDKARKYFEDAIKRFRKLANPLVVIKPTRKWDPETNTMEDTPKIHSDIYIMCFFTAESHDTANPLDLSQWKFYAFTKGRIKELLQERKSISLKFLERSGIKPFSANELKSKVREL